MNLLTRRTRSGDRGLMAIEVRNVSKRFGDFAALDDVSVTVGDGALTALLGPSGSGKSTLLRIIAGLESPDAGEVVIGGEDVTDTPARNRGVGFVFQHYAPFKHMTVHDNVAFGLSVRKRPKAEIEARVKELLGLVRLDGLAERYPSQLSGGQLQRMALARALAVQPQVLLLDEPFGALDAQVRGELREWLRRLHDEIHVTTIFVTHDQEEAMEVAEQIVVMNAGRIEQAGTPRELYETPSNEFVMSFIGPVNRIGDAFVRPHDIQILAEDDGSAHRGARSARRAPRLRGPRRADAPRRPRHLGAGHARGRRSSSSSPRARSSPVRLPPAARVRRWRLARFPGLLFGASARGRPSAACRPRPSATVTCSSTLRRLERSAIHTCCSDSAEPTYSISSGRWPRTPTSGPSTARMICARLTSSAGCASQ